MATFVLTNPKCWLHGYELQGVLSTLALRSGAELKDATAFGDATRTRKGGLHTVEAQLEGYYEPAAIDAQLFSRVGSVDVPFTAAPENAGTAGVRAFAMLAALGEYRLGGELGEMTPLSLPLQSGGPLVRGLIVHNAARTSTAAGTAYQLGQVAAGQKLYAALHVTAASAADTLDVIVESDDAEGMASPSSRAAFTQATAITAEWKEVAGAITDDWWRVSWTIAGTSPSFSFAVFLGIK